MVRDPITLDHIPPEDHQGIGLVANASAHLEGSVERIIWRLAHLDDNRGAAITTHMGIRGRMDAACALTDLEFPDSQATASLASLSGHITGKLYGQRNEIVHSRTLHLGTTFGDTTIRSTYKARGKLKKEAKPVVPSEYKTTSNDILAAASEVRRILHDFLTMIQQKHGGPSP